MADNKDIPPQPEQKIPELSVVMPALDEEEALPVVLPEASEALDHICERWEIIGVKLWDEARNEEEARHGGCYEVTTQLYRHRSHERDAQRGLGHRPSTPEIDQDVYDEWKR